MTTDSTRRQAGPVTWMLRVVWTILAVFVLIILLASVAVPAVRGWVPLTIASGSMEPTYPVGSMVIADPVTQEESRSLMTGDVITFMPYPDDPTLVTHRIIGMSRGVDGTVSYTTQGDANSVPDPDPVNDFQVRAVVKYHIPRLGYVAGWLSGHQKQALVYVIVGGLSLYTIYQVSAGIRERRRSRA
ncbi:signal peptidase I [Flaviflexus salsibiostraticola]|uniref:Signal peptidase I n=1 Tax=Flaviflexus salsibiostraticola TaxID=1282737 RepID=A0A3S8Z8B8_9ACTO|nr:signal peptidase I [Flaviflexus salsibiostraticola]AZN29694.1 signal peptidase I [Flaviflexus salsibiostraticola]